MFNAYLGLEMTGHAGPKDFSIAHTTLDLLAVLLHRKAFIGTVESLKLLLILGLEGSQFRLRDILLKQFPDYPIAIDLEEGKSD